MAKGDKERAERKTPRRILRKYRDDARRLEEFAKFTRLSKVEQMALDCFQALQEALGYHR